MLKAAEGGAEGGELTVVPRDAFGRKLYLQPLGLLLEVPRPHHGPRTMVALERV